MSSIFSNKKSSSCENTVLKAGDKTEASIRHTSKQRRRWYVKLSAVDGRMHEETVIDRVLQKVKLITNARSGRIAKSELCSV